MGRTSARFQHCKDIKRSGVTAGYSEFWRSISVDRTEHLRCPWTLNLQGFYRPAIVRGLYGYEIEDICSEQTHTILYRGRRKIDGLKVLIKLFRKSPVPDWGADWFQRDCQISQDLGASYAARSLAFERTDVGPALIYVDEGERPLEELTTKSPLDIDTALTMAASIAEAVAALHKERLIHCNLNPTTVWFNDREQPRPDFGFRLRATPFGGGARERHMAMS